MISKRIAKAKRLFAGRKALAAAGVSCVVFFAIGILIRYSPLQEVDLRVTKELQEVGGPPVRMVMVALTMAGEPVVLPVLGSVAAVCLWAASFSKAAVFVLLSLTSIPLNIGLKTLWDRARPDAEVVSVAVETAGTSFPSGHAMGATSLYGAFAALTWIHLDRRRYRTPITLTLLALPVAIDVSRVYLGAHWLSDVVGGSALGLLVLIPSVWWYVKSIPAEVNEQPALTA